MKTFTIKYDPVRAKSSKKRMADAIKSGKKDVNCDELICGSFKSLLKIATESRLELFHAIRDKCPRTLNQLAEYVGKDPAYVLREVRILQELGIIKMERDDEDPRGRLIIEALYDRIIIDTGEGQKQARRTA